MSLRHSLISGAIVTLALSGFGLAQNESPTQQQEPPTQGVVKKGKVPLSSQVPKITLPRPTEADLPNGLHLLVLEDHRLPQVNFQMFISGAGGYYDPADHAGLAQFTAALMREGTTTRTSEQLSRQLDVMAATLTVEADLTGLEATVTGSCLSDQLPDLVDLTADVLLHPAFAEEELTRYKQRTRTGLIQARANPGFLAREMFQKAVYGTHPASRVSATIAALDKTTREAMMEFHHAHYMPDRAALAFSGDISMAEARRLVAAKLGGWKKAGVSIAPTADPAPINGSHTYFIARPNSVQTSFVVGGAGMERTDPDYDKAQVMNRILGGSSTGRLFIHLREEKGYTYGITSTFTSPIYRGDWFASTSVRTEVTEPALHDLLAEIAAMRDVPVTDEELADAKRAMVTSFALSLESPASLLNYHVIRWRYKLPLDYWDRYAERVNVITKADIQAMAKKYLAAGALQIVAVGDPMKVVDVLKKLGEVETYDADGRRVGAS
jgi:zinc protease